MEDIATADIAFEAWGKTLEEMFVAAADATMNVMVDDLDSIADRKRQMIEVSSDEIDMLLFEMLQELIFFKDADSLLLRIPAVTIEKESDHLLLTGEAYGEKIDPSKHELIVDVKAVTLHRFAVTQIEEGWIASVILDI
jgi:SHS2 domain-containing protein